MFEGIAASRSNMVLSYSNTGMITMAELEEIAALTFGANYHLELETTDHKHMTLGRQGDRHRDVEECLVLAKRKIAITSRGHLPQSWELVCPDEWSMRHILGLYLRD